MATTDLDDSNRANRFAAEQWPQVRIVRVELQTLDDLASDGPVRVFAQVYLGALLPADVTVTLLPGFHYASEHGDSSAERRMASARSYANGSYVFEANLARGEIGGERDWLVRVTPGHGGGSRQCVAQVTRPSAFRHSTTEQASATRIEA